MDRLCALAADAMADARSAGMPAPVGVGISSPGPLDPWAGVVLARRTWPAGRTCRWSNGWRPRSPCPPSWSATRTWRSWPSGATAPRDAADVIYITVSTGIGGGIVIDGRPLIGPDGTAGEVGHVTVELDGPLCGDGSPGHAEAIGSGTAIAREGARCWSRAAPRHWPPSSPRRAPPSRCRARGAGRRRGRRGMPHRARSSLGRHRRAVREPGQRPEPG